MRISILDRSAARAFRHMTFPAFRRLLDFDPALPGCLAIGTFDGAHATGLALAAIDDAGTTSRILSLYVEREQRGRGVATRLAAAVEDALARVGARDVAAKYMSGQPTTAALEAVLRKRGWDVPVPNMLVVRCTLASIRDAPWLKQYPLPHGWAIAPWIDLNEGEREDIRRTQQTTSWFPPEFDPFRYEPGLEPLTSLALRVHGAVCGWQITHAVNGVLRFTCGFVREDLQRMGRLLLLVNEAIARARQAGMSEGMWTVRMEHESMVRFVRRRMQPYSTFFGETRITRKTLPPPTVVKL